MEYKRYQYIVITVVSIVLFLCICSTSIASRDKAIRTLINPTVTFRPEPTITTEATSIPVLESNEEFNQYSNDIAPGLLDVLSGLEKFQRDDPTKDDFREAIKLVKKGYSSINKVEPPESLLSVHLALVDGVSDCNTSVEYLELWLDGVNPNYIDTAVRYIRSCSNKLKSTNALLEEYKLQNDL